MLPPGRAGGGEVAGAAVQPDQEPPGAVPVGVEPKAAPDGLDGVAELARLSQAASQGLRRPSGGQPQALPVRDHPFGGALLGEQVAPVELEG